MNATNDSSNDDDFVPDHGYGDWPEANEYRGVKRAVLGVILVLVLALGGFFAWRTLVPIDHKARALEFLEVGDYPSAVIELKHVIQQNPDDAERRWQIGNAYLQMDQPNYAMEYLQGAFDRGYRTPNLLLALARTKLLLREYEDALKLYREWSDVDSNEDAASWEVLRGGSLLNLGKHDAAVKAYMQALRLDPTNGEAKWGLAQSGMGVELSGLSSEELDRALSTGLDQPETWLLKAELALSQGNFEESRVAFEKAVELGPYNVYALAGLVRILIATNQLDDAKEPIAVLTQQFPTDPMSAYVRALYANQLQQYELALDSLNIVLSHEPNHAMSILLQGEVQYAMGNVASAKDSLTQFHRMLPDSVLGRKRLAEVLIESGAPDGAVSLLEPLVDQVHRDTEIATLLATAYAKLGDTRRAKAYQALSLKLDSESTGASLALENLNRGDTEEAIEELEQLVSQNPEKMERRIMLAVSQLRVGEFDKALAISGALLAEKPDDPQVQYLHGTALELSNNADSAVAFYERALELDPKFSAADLALARVDLDSGRRGEARQRIEALLTREPDNATAQVWLAQLAMQDGDSKEAIRRFEAARADDKSALQPRLILADIYLRVGDADKALDVSREIVKLAPSHPIGNYLLGNALVQAGNYSEGLVVLALLEQTHPDNLKLKWRIVEAQEQMGDAAAAYETLQRVLTIDKQNERALLKLAMIERNRGNTDAAFELASRLAKAHPTSEMGFLIKGQLLLDSEDYLVASDLLERAFVLNSNAITLSRYYTALARAGETEKAEKVMEEWLEENPTDSVARLALAEQSARDGNPSRAIEEYEWVARREPENVAVLVLLAAAYHDKGDRRDLKTAQKAYEMAPEDLYAKHLYAWLLVETGLSERGAELLREVVNRQPGNPVFGYHLAVALNESGSTEQAKAVLKTLAESELEYDEREQADALMKKLGVEKPAAQGTADE
jgi:putative PEP-CTERM system TPR-repeat lipoprotein